MQQLQTYETLIEPLKVYFHPVFLPMAKILFLLIFFTTVSIRFKWFFDINWFFFYMPAMKVVLAKIHLKSQHGTLNFSKPLKNSLLSESLNLKFTRFLRRYAKLAETLGWIWIYFWENASELLLHGAFYHIISGTIYSFAIQSIAHYPHTYILYAISLPVIVVSHKCITTFHEETTPM